MTCDHKFVERAHASQSDCVVCLKQRVEFEHARWKDCAESYAKERARRQELEQALTMRGEA